MDYSQFLAMKQEIGLLTVFLLVFLYDTFMPKRTQGSLPAFATVLTLALTVCGFFCTSGNVTAFAGMYETSTVITAIKNILNIGVVIVLIQSIKWANSEFTIMRRGEFYELLLVTLFGMYLMISARHFLLFVIGLEAASLPLAAMVAFDKKHYESHEAAVKYILTAVFSSAIFLLGLSYVYGLTGSLYFENIYFAITGKESIMLVVALAFVIAGIGFKLSLVPFHLWTADVYQGAPTSVTSYLSVISKGAAAFAFLVIMAQVFGTVYSLAWEWMLYALIILTITIGNLFALRQRNMKRFLAFSSISQAGYIMLGVIAFNSTGMASLMYYILVYIFSNLAAFGVIQAIENATGRVSMDDYNGFRHDAGNVLASRHPAFCGLLQQVLHFYRRTAAGYSSNLRACADRPHQHHSVPVLLPACGERNVHQPRPVPGRAFPLVMQRTSSSNKIHIQLLASNTIHTRLSGTHNCTTIKVARP